jgi:hypothetical protein
MVYETKHSKFLLTSFSIFVKHKLVILLFPFNYNIYKANTIQKYTFVFQQNSDKFL